MSSSARVIVALLALLGGILVVPSAVLAVATPKAKTAAREGPSGRYMLDGDWHERPDPGDSAVRESLPASTSLTGWRPVTVPLAANAGDFSPSSYTGSVHWYRKDFRLPRARGGSSWRFRFESVSHRATVWLNGRLLGSHVGAYLPFELSARSIHRG